jgi:hypothetical protein
MLGKSSFTIPTLTYISITTIIAIAIVIIMIIIIVEKMTQHFGGWNHRRAPILIVGIHPDVPHSILIIPPNYMP